MWVSSFVACGALIVVTFVWFGAGMRVVCWVFIRYVGYCGVRGLASLWLICFVLYYCLDCIGLLCWLCCCDYAGCWILFGTGCGWVFPQFVALVGLVFRFVAVCFTFGWVVTGLVLLWWLRCWLAGWLVCIGGLGRLVIACGWVLFSGTELRGLRFVLLGLLVVFGVWVGEFVLMLWRGCGFDCGWRVEFVGAYLDGFVMVILVMLVLLFCFDLFSLCFCLDCCVCGLCG